MGCGTRVEVGKAGQGEEPVSAQTVFFDKYVITLVLARSKYEEHSNRQDIPR
jgi:hypothetical protein